MQINIIHDPARTDRKVLLNSEIIEHDLDVKLWDPVIDEERSFRGISLAHKQIVRWARDSRLPMVCIGEDDLRLTAKGSWKYFMDNIPADFDIYLSGVYCGKIEKDRTIKDFCALHLYIVHARFYDCFLGVDEMNNIDRAMNGRGKYIVSKPFCAIQHPGWSDHKKKYAEYDHILREQYSEYLDFGVFSRGNVSSF